MTKILSWNIQNGRGYDGKVSLSRIASTIRKMGDPDIICLQEVSVNFLLSDGSYADQVADLTTLFTDYQVFFGPAIDMWDRQTGERCQFGNMVLSRFPVHTAFCHPLPQPPHASVKQMPRQLIEVSIETPTKALRVMTTHLEYHSETQRTMQCKRILDIQNEVAAVESAPPKHDINGPYRLLNRGKSCVICGDFNFLPASKEYQLFSSPIHTKSALLDAWKVFAPDQPQPPTCGIFDEHQWPEGAHCRDFMFVTPDLRDQILDVRVDTATSASDHQPVMLVLE